MSVLADCDIWHELKYGELDVSPVDYDEQIQPNSLDIRLGDEFVEYAPDFKNVVDSKKGIDEDKYVEWDWMDSITVDPDDFILGTTVENFDVPDYLYGQVHGRSSVGRLGIEIHSTAGLIDAGYSGEITLEISNNSRKPITLYSGMRIAQVVFHELKNRSTNPYSNKRNKYQGQKGATASRIQEDFEE